MKTVDEWLKEYEKSDLFDQQFMREFIIDIQNDAEADQFKTIDHRSITPELYLIKIAEACGFCERDGGLEGIYYSHPDIEGEWSFKDLPFAIRRLVGFLASRIKERDQ